MIHIALATSTGFSDLAPDDQLLPPAFAALGIRATAVPWDSRDFDWAAPRAILVRSCWDYHRRPGEFARWVDGLGARGLEVWNDAATLRWNMDKRYLLELRRGGAPVPPTELLVPANGASLATTLADRGWTEAVVKPVFGASADGIWRTSAARAGADQSRLDAQLELGSVLVQPFLHEVGAVGEVSLVYLDGAFSHAVRKRPGAGDFRVQRALGGTSERVTPAGELLEAAGRVLAAVSRPPLYARVDMIETNRGPQLIELELIEPELFFGAAPGSAERLARAAASRLAAASSAAATDGRLRVGKDPNATGGSSCPIT